MILKRKFSQNPQRVDGYYDEKNEFFPEGGIL